MKPTMDDARDLWVDLKKAADAAFKLLRSPSTDTKCVPLFQTVPVVFPITSGVFPSEREVTWVNPGGDAHFTEIGHQTVVEVYRGFANPPVSVTLPLFDSEIGLVRENRFMKVYPVIFDFEWNFRYARNRAQYGIESASGGEGYLSRKSFGNPLRNQMLGWPPNDTLDVLAGDAVTWKVLPTYLDFETWSFGEIRSITVNLFMNGWQTGTPAEADYELGR